MVTGRCIQAAMAPGLWWPEYAVRDVDGAVWRCCLSRNRAREDGDSKLRASCSRATTRTPRYSTTTQPDSVVKEAKGGDTADTECSIESTINNKASKGQVKVNAVWSM